MKVNQENIKDNEVIFSVPGTNLRFKLINTPKFLSVKPKKKTKTIPRIKKGAKGISLLIVKFLSLKNNEGNFEERISARPKIEPIQNAKIIEEIPSVNPMNQPIPKASLASPNPIQQPFDTNQRSAKGVAKINPDKRFSVVIGIVPKNNKPKKDRPAKIKAKLSGIILC